MGLLHAAAAGGDAPAMLALALRYRRGWGVERSDEAAAWYFEGAARAASDDFHAAGQQPHYEVG